MMTLFFDALLILAFLAACLGLVELGRVVIYRICIDWLELTSRYHQMILDNDKQRLKLEWSEVGILQLTASRKRLQESEVQQ